MDMLPKDVTIKRLILIATVLSLSEAAWGAECSVEVHWFSTVSKLDHKYHSIPSRDTSFLDHVPLDKMIKSPPKSGGTEHCKELSLLTAQRKPSGSEIEQIKCEQDLMCFQYGGTSLENLFRMEEFSGTRALIMSSIWHLDQKLFSLKLFYDRSRPSQADSAITPLIPLPGHASYPSGHAAQATLVAQILSILQPVNRSKYMDDAKRIARNRELALLHYPSDSDAGEDLAKIFFHDLKESRWFKQGVKNASEEWRTIVPSGPHGLRNDTSLQK